MADQPAERDEHGDHDLRRRALREEHGERGEEEIWGRSRGGLGEMWWRYGLREEHDERGEEQLAKHLDELPVPRAVLVLGVEEAVALVRVRV